MDNENWVDMKGYEGIYKVSDQGRIYSVPRVEKKFNILTKTISTFEYGGIYLKPVIQKSGYANAQLSKKGKQKSVRWHRIIAKHFVNNPYNKPQVNHINEDKLDNRACNLEWATAKENTNHNNMPKRRGKSKRIPVIRIDKEGNKKRFDSITHALKYHNKKINNSNIGRCLSGESKTYLGYKWVEEEI